MTVEEIVELVYLRITGGEPTPDSSVLRIDIRYYVPDAVNAVMVQQYGVEQGLENDLKPNPLFLQVFENITPTFDSVSGKFTFTLPKRALSIPAARSIKSVSSSYGIQYQPFSPEDQTMGAYYIQTNRKLPAFDIDGQEITLYNYLSGNVTVKQLVHIDDYAADTDQIFIPSGTTSTLVDILYNMVVTQKSNPKDSIIDGKDNVK